MGFAPVDLGSIAEGSKLQQTKGPLAALNLIKASLNRKRKSRHYPYLKVTFTYVKNYFPPHAWLPPGDV
jgi:hypothetical protein